MWEKVAKRSHKPVQIYAFGNGADEVMLHGTVEYVLKDGRGTETSMLVFLFLLLSSN